MRYSLQTLILAMLFGGPLVAGTWFALNWIAKNPVQTLVLSGLFMGFMGAAAVAINVKRFVREAVAIMQESDSED